MKIYAFVCKNCHKQQSRNKELLDNFDCEFCDGKIVPIGYEATPSNSYTAGKKAKYRTKKRKDGWFSAGFTGPADAIEYIKTMWSTYKKDNSHLWKQ